MVLMPFRDINDTHIGDLLKQVKQGNYIVKLLKEKYHM